VRGRFQGAWKRVLLAIGIAIWLPAIGFGFRTLLRYSYTAGTAAQPPSRWPGKTPNRPALLLFAHPNCPCTRATLNELSGILARARTRPETTVIFHIPASEPGTWGQTDLWRTAKSLPGVQVIDDRGGVWSRRFGAYTSGQVLFYDAGGKLGFNGGITPARGHEGSNYGREAILALLNNREPEHKMTPVFGCSLRGD